MNKDGWMKEQMVWWIHEWRDELFRLGHSNLNRQTQTTFWWLFLSVLSHFLVNVSD